MRTTNSPDIVFTPKEIVDALMTTYPERMHQHGINVGDPVHYGVNPANGMVGLTKVPS